VLAAIEVAMGAPLAAMSFTSHAQHGADVSAPHKAEAQQDKQDNWRFDYRESFAYQDANYGFDGRYVPQDDYNYYFREGFQRGYEDGYYERCTYGTNTNGSDSLLGTVLNMILNLQPLQ
jgi:hypothetical protein